MIAVRQRDHARVSATDRRELFLIGTFVRPLLAGSIDYRIHLDGMNRGIDRAPRWGLCVFCLLLSGLVPGLVALAVYLRRR